MVTAPDAKTSSAPNHHSWAASPDSAPKADRAMSDPAMPDRMA
jgi:hypothetical protein